MMVDCQRNEDGSIAYTNYAVSAIGPVIDNNSIGEICDSCKGRGWNSNDMMGTSFTHCSICKGLGYLPEKLSLVSMSRSQDTENLEKFVGDLLVSWIIGDHSDIDAIYFQELLTRNFLAVERPATKEDCDSQTGRKYIAKVNDPWFEFTGKTNEIIAATRARHKEQSESLMRALKGLKYPPIVAGEGGSDKP